MSVQNFMICGHGQLNINNQGFVPTFHVPNVNVITLAPPTATCSYSPENLNNLKDKLHIRNNTINNNVSSFYSVIKQEEKQILGVNYCDDEWIGHFARESNYDPNKGCGLQVSNIQDKLISFHDETAGYIVGIWELERNINILDPRYNIPLTPIPGTNVYSLSSIINFIHSVYNRNYTINILDCTCSVVYNEYGNFDNDPRLQRRLQRGVQKLLGGTKKIYMKRNTKNKGKKHTYKRNNKTNKKRKQK